MECRPLLSSSGEPHPTDPIPLELDDELLELELGTELVLELVLELELELPDKLPKLI